MARPLLSPATGTAACGRESVASRDRRHYVASVRLWPVQGVDRGQQRRLEREGAVVVADPRGGVGPCQAARGQRPAEGAADAPHPPTAVLEADAQPPSRVL